MSEAVAEHGATYRVRLFGDVEHQLDSLDDRPADAWTLQLLDALDPAALTDAQRLRALVLAQRAAAHADAVGLRMAAAMASEEGEDDWAQDEIACALGVGSMTGSRVLTSARALSGRLHRTGELLLAGRISPRKADILAERTYLLDDDAARQVEADVLPKAAGQTPTGFDNAVKAAVMTADPELAARKAKAAKAHADVRLRPAEDAMTQLVIDLPAPDGLAAFNLIDGLAGPGHPEDPRLAGERRVDAFIHLINGRYDQGNLPTRHGRPIGVGVTLTLGTAIGAAELPGQLHGYGPIPAPMARELAARGRWRAWIVDATTAHLNALGTESYRPDQALQDHVLARDGTCAFPYCDQPAERCDIDHIIPWPEGPTNPENTLAESRRHHRNKHRDWRLHRNPDGTCTWTSPLGFTYDVAPQTLPLDPPQG